MTTKLNRIKSALRESIEIASKARLNRVDVGPFFTEQQKADAAFDMNAQKMTPIACKALLTAIEGLEWVFDYTDWCADGAPDASPHDKVCNEIADKAKATLSSITSEWPDV